MQHEILCEVIGAEIRSTVKEMKITAAALFIADLWYVEELFG